MKRKLSKSALLALPLSSFNIQPLTLWVTRPERMMEQSLVNARKQLSGDALEKELAELRVTHQKYIDAQPKTVGELIKAYPYRYVHHRSQGQDYGVNGLGKEPIAALKQKLRELGLTPDDWPALVPHDELLAHLSKKAILLVPVQEILPMPDEYHLRAFSRLFGWADENGEIRKSETKTVRDLIQFDPLNLTNDAPFISQRSFFESRRRFFIALQQALVKKGFTARDGKFFNWNPIAPAFKKAQAVLRKHNLTPSELRKFAGIVVAERWII